MTGATIPAAFGPKVAIVTGANRGIGFQIAHQLCKPFGMDVIIACRDPVRGQQAAEALGARFMELDLSSDDSIDEFVERFTKEVGRLDVLINNAATAFKAADFTPFELQTGPTLRVNFWGTVRLTDSLLPLLRKSGACGNHPRLIMMASSAGRLSQLSPELQHRFSSSQLDRDELFQLVCKFQVDVANGRHRREGWGSNNYAFSKLALIAYTKVLAREEGPEMRVNACCPGYCNTELSGHKGPRPPDVGARCAVKLTMLPDDAPTGEFWQDEQVCEW